MEEKNLTHIDNYAHDDAIKDNLDANLPETAEAAEAENSTIAATDTGKFASVEALLAAYRSLEAEFTRRSQRLKELEENKADAAPSPSCMGNEELINAALGNEEVRRAVVGDYLKSVLEGKSVPIVIGGVPCVAPRSAPKSVKEAGALAKQFLKN